MNHSIYPMKTVRTEIIIKPKENILKNKMTINNKYTNIYIKYKNFKTKTSQSDYNKVKIYKGYPYLQNGYDKIIKLDEDKDIFLFFEFLINLNKETIVHQKEIDFSRLDRLLFEWDLYNISNKKVDSVRKRLDNININ